MSGLVKAVPSSPTAPLVRSGALGRLGGVLAAYEIAQQVSGRVGSFYRDRLAYTVSVNERDPMYSQVHAWLLSIMPTERHRALSVRSGSGHGPTTLEGGSADGDTESVPPLQLLFNDTRPRHVVIDGHRVMVRLNTPDVSGSAVSMRDRETPAAEIQFTTRSFGAQQAVVGHLHRLHDARRADRKPVLRMVNQWRSWRTRSDLPGRSLASVALPTAQRTRIVEDLGRFLDAEEQYNRLAIPWHRGYLFHGPPGTGKTSLVKALASHFRLDLWYVSLSDLNAESGLMGLLSEVGPRSMLLLEDIDTIQIATDREGADQGKISTSSLLNALDGVATPHGLVTVMTTNHYDRLDKALVRAGRMDLVEELGYSTPATVAALYRHFYGRTTTIAQWPDGVAAAAVAEVFKQHLDDPDAAIDGLLHLAAEHEVRSEP